MSVPIAVSSIAWTLFAAAGEEIGWRGYALPRLQATKSALFSSLLIGALWGLWHLTGGRQSMRGLQIVNFTSWVLLDSILITWVYNSTHGSLLMTWLFHAAHNGSVHFLPYSVTTPSRLAGPIGFLIRWIVVLVVIRVEGWRHLARVPVSEAGAAPATPSLIE